MHLIYVDGLFCFDAKHTCQIVYALITGLSRVYKFQQANTLFPLIKNK